MLKMYCLFVIAKDVTKNIFSFRFRSIVISKLKQQLAKSNTRYTTATLKPFLGIARVYGFQDLMNLAVPPHREIFSAIVQMLYESNKNDRNYCTYYVRHILTLSSKRQSLQREFQNNNY